MGSPLQTGTVDVLDGSLVFRREGVAPVLWPGALAAVISSSTEEYVRSASGVMSTSWMSGIKLRNLLSEESRRFSVERHLACREPRTRSDGFILRGSVCCPVLTGISTGTSDSTESFLEFFPGCL